MICMKKTFISRVQNEAFAGILHITISEQHNTVEYLFAYSLNDASNLKMVFSLDYVDTRNITAFTKSLKGTIAELLSDDVKTVMYNSLKDIYYYAAGKN